MTNMEIIANEAMMVGYPYDGDNLKTFKQWNSKGYKIIRGSKALIKTKLWRPIVEVDKETKKEVKRMIMVSANLFSVEQVEKGGN